jgi:hypothetical protein
LELYQRTCASARRLPVSHGLTKRQQLLSLLVRIADICTTLKSTGAGTFKLTLEFAEDYPNKAPVVKIVSAMFHPNGAMRRPRNFAVHTQCPAGLCVRR